MSQLWTNDSFAAGHVGQTDLTNMEKNFICLRTLFSGAAQPASMAACHPWFDTTKHVLKVRSDDDSAWYGLMHGDTSQKIWVYRNTAMTGWAVDAGVSDKVLALKGGATYTTGATSAGTWTQPNHVHTGPNHDHTSTAHTHAVGSYRGPSHTHGAGTLVGPSHNHFLLDYGGHIASRDPAHQVARQTSGPDVGRLGVIGGAGIIGYNQVQYITNAGGIGAVTGNTAADGTSAITGDSASTTPGPTGAGGIGATSANATVITYRPAAAVGTLQYLDL